MQKALKQTEEDSRCVRFDCVRVTGEQRGQSGPKPSRDAANRSAGLSQRRDPQAPRPGPRCSAFLTQRGLAMQLHGSRTSSAASPISMEMSKD